MTKKQKKRELKKKKAVQTEKAVFNRENPEIVTQREEEKKPQEKHLSDMEAIESLVSQKESDLKKKLQAWTFPTFIISVLGFMNYYIYFSPTEFELVASFVCSCSLSVLSSYSLLLVTFMAVMMAIEQKACYTVITDYNKAKQTYEALYALDMSKMLPMAPSLKS